MKTYVEVPGNAVGRLPYIARESVLHGFFFESDFGTLNRLCDRLLNDPSDGALLFRAPSHMVLLNAVYVARMSSGDAVDQSKGFVKEVDVGFWIPVFGGLRLNPLSWRLRWLPVYLFVDPGAAVAAGREVFGFPKLHASVTRTSDDMVHDGTFSVATQYFGQFGPNEEAEFDTLFSLVTDATMEGAPYGGLAELDAAVAAALSARRSDDTPHEALSAAGVTLGASMPMIFLKQFRDVAVANAACLQQVCTVTAEASNITHVGTISGDHTLVLAPSASHPIADDLGISNGQTNVMGFVVHHDFEVGFGEILWE